MSSEFLKNNELALRQCLLYEFLQTKDAKNAYSNFIKAVGDDVIVFENFKFWFDRFSEGKFDEDDNQEPISDMKTVLQNDEKAIRACILYDFLKEKKSEIDQKIETFFEGERLVPIGSKTRKFGKYIVPVHDLVFYLYLEFCQVLGDDVIEYQDFQFWYYRFANEEFDMEDIQIENDEKTVNLENIPIAVMGKIVEKLDYYGRCSFRRVSKRLQQISNTFNFKMDEMYIYITNNDITFHLQPPPEIIIFFGDLNYHITGKYFKKTFSGENHVKNALHDMEIIFKNPKFQLKFLKIKFFCDSDRFKKRADAITNYFQLLSDAPQFHVESLEIRSEYFDPLMPFLPYMKPGVLQKIYLRSAIKYLGEFRNIMPKMVDLEQWKQAEELKFMEFYNHSYVHLAYFKKFEIKISDFTVNKLKNIKTLLSICPNIEECTLNFYLDEEEEVNLNDIKAELGNPSSQEENLFIFSIPGSKEYFKIKLSPSVYDDDDEFWGWNDDPVPHSTLHFKRNA